MLPAARTRLSVLGASAPSPHSPELSEVASVLRVLGDPTRLSILAMLAREDEPLCVCHVESRFALAQPTISHHLRVLRDARLVTSDKRGTWVYYAADRGRVASVRGLSELLSALAPAPASERAACCR